MLSPENILDRLLLVGGPPRSGTTFIARALNAHPRIVTAIDDHVHECWALYHYPTRQGLVHDLRRGPMARTEAIGLLKAHLFSGDRFSGVAPSFKTAGVPLSHSPQPLAAVTPGMKKAVRHAFPLERLAADWYLCLKSPEISFVLPRLAEVLPPARFVMVFRPVSEIAESMFRKGMTVRALPVFQRRWEGERTDDGQRIPPPGVPQEWSALWREVTGFQRCVIYAASYVKAIITGCALLPEDRFFIYDHSRLREHSAPIMRGLASFLGVEQSGFSGIAAGLSREVPALSSELVGQCAEMWEKLDLEALARRIADLGDRTLSRLSRDGA